MIVSRAHPEMIEEAAVRDGMITLSQDGLIKCLRGETSIEEVLRVTREIDR
jgi:type II secretory ATPase GspE/PulE/Tfp pilus assembly ATPase PilB-like protein